MTIMDKDNKYWNGHRMVVKFGSVIKIMDWI
jgi:hypothetical protein